MEVAKAQEAKRALELEIARVIRNGVEQFERDSGLRVQAIEIRTVDSLGPSQHYVRVEVSL
jgi:hypothetical protein